MNELQIYTILEKHNFSSEDSKSLIAALKEKSESHTPDYATPKDVQDLEIKMLQEFLKIQEQISGLLGKTLAGTAAIIAVATYLIKAH